MFIWHERRTPQPMLPMELFKRRNFAFGNIETFSMYGGLGSMFFFLTLFLQQVAGYTALQAGFATIPTTLVMFSLSRYAGRLADRHGPRWFMGCGPLVAACGVALMTRLQPDLNYWTDLFPALLLFSLGLAATVAPLTATVLADADEHNAGIASGVNNAIARVAGLLCVAALGAVVAAVYAGDLGGRAAQDTLAVIPGVPESLNASVHAFHVGHRDLRRAGGGRRRARARRDPQPAPRSLPGWTGRGGVRALISVHGPGRDRIAACRRLRRDRVSLSGVRTLRHLALPPVGAARPLLRRLPRAGRDQRP